MSTETEFIPEHIDQIDTTDLERYIGKYVEQPVQGFYHVTYDTIRHFAWALDDYNALYADPAYARDTRWREVIAPPAYLYAHGGGPVWARTVGNMPGITVNDNAGEQWEFYLPIRHGDQVISNSKTYDFQKRQGRRAGPLVIVYSETLLTNQRGELVARVVGSSFRFNRSGVVQRGGHAQGVTGQEGGVLRSFPDEPPPIPESWGSRDNLRKDPQRYFEEVNEGDELPTLNRGIYHPNHGRNWSAATGNIGGNWGGGVPVDVSSAPDGPMVTAYTAAGVMRAGWFGHYVTMWAGPNAWLTRLSHQNREWVLPGYEVIVKGRVTGKRVEDGKHLVDLDLWVENDLGLVTNPGNATVELPALQPPGRPSVAG